MPGRFTFRFDTLLKVRQQREDSQKRIVAARMRQLDELHRRATLLESRIADQTESLRETLRSGSVEIDDLKWARHAMIQLRRALLETSAETASQRAVLAQEQAALAEARKETRILERLRERQKEAHDAQNKREEQLQTDEMNVSRYIHAGLSES